MKKIILFILIANISPFLSDLARAEADACKPFFDIEEVKQEDKDSRDAIKKVKQASQQVDEFQAFCATQKADNTLSNQDQLIMADQNQRDAVMIKNNVAKDALKKAQETAEKALRKMNDPEVKKRPGRSDCAKSLIADNDTLNDAKAKLNAKGSALSSCSPPAKKIGGYDSESGCNQSRPMFGCSKNSDNSWTRNQAPAPANPAPAPAPSYAPVDSNGQTILHPSCPTCR